MRQAGHNLAGTTPVHRHRAPGQSSSALKDESLVGNKMKSSVDGRDGPLQAAAEGQG